MSTPNVITVKAKIPARSPIPRVLPIVIPDQNEVRSFAQRFHTAGKYWVGELFGWPAEYTPQSRKKPIGSKMKCTPAQFWIGETGIWFFSLMWERGKKQEPVEFLDDRGIVQTDRK